jgi:hypothetical protein
VFERAKNRDHSSRQLRLGYLAYALAFLIGMGLLYLHFQRLPHTMSLTQPPLQSLPESEAIIAKERNHRIVLIERGYREKELSLSPLPAFETVAEQLKQAPEEVTSVLNSEEVLSFDRHAAELEKQQSQAGMLSIVKGKGGLMALDKQELEITLPELKLNSSEEINEMQETGEPPVNNP